MKHLVVLLYLPILLSCASVPKNAPLLNQRVSEGINELKRQHLQSISHIYSLSIEKVDKDYDRFLEKAKEIYMNKTGNTPSTEQEYYKVSILAAQIREKVLFEIRSNLEEVRRKIEENYDLVEDMNHEVTQYLYSAVKVKESERSILDFINRNIKVDLDIDRQISDLSETIETIIKGGKSK